jgi:hypothetical protein
MYRSSGLRFRRTPPARCVGRDVLRVTRGLFMHGSVHLRSRFFGRRQRTLRGETLSPNPPGFLTSRIRGCVIEISNSALDVRGCVEPLSVLKGFVFGGLQLRNDRGHSLRKSQCALESAVQVHRTDAACPGG